MAFATPQNVASVATEPVVVWQPAAGSVSTDSIASIIGFLDAIQLTFQICVLLLRLPQGYCVLVDLPGVEQIDQELCQRPEDKRDE